MYNFSFGKYTEITDLALDQRPEYKKEGYIRFFICLDTWDFWFVKILQGYNVDYEHDEGSYILERDKIAKHRKSENLTLLKVKTIIDNDDYSNFDIQHSYDIDTLIKMIDGGFGINNLKEGN